MAADGSILIHALMKTYDKAAVLKSMLQKDTLSKEVGSRSLQDCVVEKEDRWSGELREPSSVMLPLRCSAFPDPFQVAKTGPSSHRGEECPESEGVELPIYSELKPLYRHIYGKTSCIP